MIQNDEYTEFDLKAIVFYILRKWKPMVAWGLVLALVLGGWMAYGEYQTSLKEDTNSGYWLEYRHYQDQIAVFEDRITTTQSRIDTIEDYLRESVLMRIDPRNVYRAQSVYYVDSGYQIMPEMTYQNTNKTSTLTWYYRRYLTRYQVFEEIGGKLGLDPKYLTELVEVSQPNESTFCISVDYMDAAGAKLIMDMLEDQLENARKELLDTIADHTLAKMEESSGIYIDDSLRDLQKDTEEEILDLKDDLIEYTEELQEIKDGPKPSELNVVKEFIKWFVLGGMVGAVLVAVCVFVKSFVGNRIHATAQLASALHANVLGEMICSKNTLPSVARALNAMEGCLTENSEGNLLYLAENVKKNCGKALDVLVCCDIDSGVADAVAKSVGAHLTGLRFHAAGNLLKDASALQQLAQCDAVMMVVERDKSRSNAVKSMMKTVVSYEKEIVGFVMTY